MFRQTGRKLFKRNRICSTIHHRGVTVHWRASLTVAAAISGSRHLYEWEDRARQSTLGRLQAMDRPESDGDVDELELA